jgi:hypothetical protein
VGVLRETHLSQESDWHSLPVRRRGVRPQISRGIADRNQLSCLRLRPPSMTITEACHHFVQREIDKRQSLRTMEVESWLRRLPLAKSRCAKIRNILSVLFNHACRHELFNRNPIRLVRQGAKRRTTPSVLTPPERAVNLKTPTEVGTQSSGVYCRRPSRRRAAP